MTFGNAAVAAIFRGDIGASWARAEDHLGDYWRIRSLTEVPGGWEAVATDGNRIRIGHGSRPSLALDALVATSVATEPPDSPSD